MNMENSFYQRGRRLTVIRKIKRNIKRLGILSVVLAQVATVGFVTPAITANAQASAAITRDMEMLDRGVVAVKTNDGVYVSWRRLATESAELKFSLYRNDKLVVEDAITNYVDKEGTAADQYTVVVNGEMSDTVSVWADQYIEIPLADPPKSDNMRTDRNGIYYGAYAPGDSTYADLDGDGEYEILMMWNPPDAKDAASGGQTGKVYIDAYKLDGTRLWQIDMGYNIRAGAHDTQFCAADFNGDGKAELILRTADGTIDGTGKMIGDEERGSTYEKSWAALNGGKNLQGPLYVTCFDGVTGAALDTIPYHPDNTHGSMEGSLSFGDDFGNRSERYNGTVAWLDGKMPSAVLCRGYYMGKNGRQRMGAAAYDFRNGKLTERWTFDTADSKYANYVGQGNHQVEAADIDGDGMDEVIIGALAWDHDGSVYWCTGLGHGDAMHISDFDPRYEGLEVLTAHEESGKDFSMPFLQELGIKDALGITSEMTQMNWGLTMQNAKTGKFLQAYQGNKDTGRGVAANIGYKDSYYVMWGAGGTGYHDHDGNDIGNLGLSMNGRIYWSGDLQSELQDHNGAGKEIVISKWNDSTSSVDKIFVPKDTHSINSTKGNVNLQGDLFGDWREEFASYVITDEKTSEENLTIKGDWDKDVEVTVQRSEYKYALRVYTTTMPTDYNFYTLAHDDVYRNSSGAYGNCYNQPPHISWYMNDAIEGSEYTTQPAANVRLVANSYKAKAFDAASLPKEGERPAVDAPFVDVASDFWASDYILEMHKAGIINGMGDNKFEPNGSVTKGQFVKMITAAAGIKAGAAADGEHWAAPFVKAAKDASLINDAIAMETADLDQSISREQMASIVAAAAKYKEVSVTDEKTNFTDEAAISDWAKNDVQTAAALGIITGFEEGDFKPAEGATRAQAATMLSRLMAKF